MSILNISMKLNSLNINFVVERDEKKAKKQEFKSLKEGGFIQEYNENIRNFESRYGMNCMMR